MGKHTSEVKVKSSQKLSQNKSKEKPPKKKKIRQNSISIPDIKSLGSLKKVSN